MFFEKLFSFFMAGVIALSSALSFIPESVWFGDEKYSVSDEESILLNVALISDTHSSSELFNERSALLRKLLCGISHTENIPDALVIAGDISNASDPKEYRMLEWSMGTFNKIHAVIPAAGNHDVRACDTYDEAKDYFCDFAAFCGIETDKTYYSSSVSGFTFIVLGSEDMLSLEAEISDEQLQWFESELLKAMKTDKPVFIVCHQPLYNSNNCFYNPEAEKHYGVGAQSEKLEAIFRKYVPDYGKPVFFINGHLHRSYSEYSTDKTFCKNLICVNLPSAAKTENGGLGMAMEVYPDKILLRARNYITGEWLENYRTEILTDN